MAKPKKVEEPAGPYVVSPKPPDASGKSTLISNQKGVRHSSADDVRATNARLMQVHQEVLRKLAQ
jgi:hypothetical protein